MTKKLIVIALAAVGGWFAYKKIQSGKAEQNLWAEATDPVASSSSH